MGRPNLLGAGLIYQLAVAGVAWDSIPLKVVRGINYSNFNPMLENSAAPCFLSLQSMERTCLNVARFRSLTTEPSSTLAHRISPTHRTSDALGRNAPGQPVHL